MCWIVDSRETLHGVHCRAVCNTPAASAIQRSSRFRGRQQAPPIGRSSHMECERAQELYVDHLAGRLDSATGRDVQSHITGCALCRAETDRLAEMWSALGELPAPVVDAGRVERVSRLADAAAMRRASRAPELVRTPRRAAIVATLAVAASAAAFVAGLRLGGRTDPIHGGPSATVAASAASSLAG